MNSRKEEATNKTFIEEEIQKLLNDIKKHKIDRERYYKILEKEEESRREERQKGNSPCRDYSVLEEETNLDIEAVEYYITRDQEKIEYLLSEGTIDELIEEERKEVKWAEEALRDSTKNIVETRKKINLEKDTSSKEHKPKKRKRQREEDTLEYKLEGFKVARDFWEDEVYKKRRKLSRLLRDKELTEETNPTVSQPNQGSS